MKKEMGVCGGVRLDGAANKLVFRNVNFFRMLCLRNLDI